MTCTRTPCAQPGGSADLRRGLMTYLIDEIQEEPQSTMIPEPIPGATPRLMFSLEIRCQFERAEFEYGAFVAEMEEAFAAENIIQYRHAVNWMDPKDIIYTRYSAAQGFEETVAKVQKLLEKVPGFKRASVDGRVTLAYHAEIPAP